MGLKVLRLPFVACHFLPLSELISIKRLEQGLPLLLLISSPTSVSVYLRNQWHTVVPKSDAVCFSVTVMRASGMASDTDLSWETWSLLYLWDL